MKTLLPEMPKALLPLAERGGEKEPPSRCWELRAAADGEAELLVYDQIAWYGVDPAALVRDLSKMKASTINVRLNSPGGDVFGGVAIYNALARHPARVVVHVDALAASIASIIAMAGEEVVMHAGSFMMIHDPHVLGMGNAEEFRTLATWLDTISASMAEIYASRTGLTLDEIRALMRDETWMNGADAVDRGFADAVGEQIAAEARFDLTVFAKVPGELVGSRPELQEKGFTARTAERALRDAGASREQAKAIIANGFKAPSDSREATEGELDPAAVERLQARMLNLRLETFSRTLVRN